MGALWAPHLAWNERSGGVLRLPVCDGRGEMVVAPCQRDGREGVWRRAHGMRRGPLVIARVRWEE
jgi:hypothetical protein